MLDSINNNSETQSTCNVSSAKRHAFCQAHSRCGHTSCEMCQWIKGKIIVQTVDAQAADRMNLLSITLTLPPSTQGLPRQLKQLIRAFKDLRRQAPWRRSIVGGVRCIHFPYRRTSQAWHPHIHVLAEGWSAEADLIIHGWLKLTGGYARIRVIENEEHRRRMAWYVSKSPNGDLKDQPDMLMESVRARRGVRLKATFGNFRGVPLIPVKRKSTSRSDPPSDPKTIKAATPTDT